ncbi:5'-nucleotidase [Nannocystis pusilla]|uniref:5'-nucleotidase n=1 Tax=Nannocystis pusilla TaxID=889268 RepID=A0A9X3ETD7_9BACT|nr:5'-nucleotidase [Nannocystis pusilla]MCY1008940.1 5'-nucleotidase [Nannocystis pusilla]
MFVTRRKGENPLGNLLVDLMLRARPDVDAAIINGGGVRADLPAGPLRYGALYETFPFDNRFARVKLRAGDFAAMLAGSLGGGPFFSLGGLQAVAGCDGPDLRVTLQRAGVPLDASQEIVVLASDFLATGGDRAFAGLLERGLATVTLEDDPPLREALAAELGKLGPVSLAPLSYYDPEHPRIRAPPSPRSAAPDATCPSGHTFLKGQRRGLSFRTASWPVPSVIAPTDLERRDPTVAPLHACAAACSPSATHAEPTPRPDLSLRTSLTT